MRIYKQFLTLVLWASSVPLFSADVGSTRYALILTDEPVARMHKREELQSVRAINYRQTVQAAQDNLRTELERRGFVVTGAVQTVLNAVFVQATKERVEELRSLPGVKSVMRVPRMRVKLDAAVKLVNANPAGWNTVGGVADAGKGLKIAIIDTGIDQTHPAFQDSSLPIPSGFPKCNQPSYCTSFTNHKVIVARSYINQPGPVDPTTSVPDDPTPRDRIGHGTATAMVAAGETNTGPSDTITGLAPKAYLGNYKIFGSGYNPFGQGIIEALDDALNDGMDIASMSFGGAALGGPLDSGAVCGNPPGESCDPEVQAIETAVADGMVVVCAAGNEGDLNQAASTPAYETIGSPAYSPSAIAVGGTSNSHFWENQVTVSGSGVPANIQHISALFGDGPLPVAALKAPGVDVTSTGNDGYACSAIHSSSLQGDIVLVERGPSGPSACTFEQKVTNVENAGAVGVVIYDDDSVEQLENLAGWGGVSGTSIPSIMISNSDGLSLKQYLDAHPGHSITIDPALFSPIANQPDLLSTFSSRGPTTGSMTIKPEVVAIDEEVYMATESTDPTGPLYSPNRYTVADGTSFSTPMVSGAAALVKQKHPGLKALDIKSALVNTANSSVVGDEYGTAPHVIDMGGGLLDVEAAVNSNVSIVPSTLSFGIVKGSFPAAQTLQITNTGSSSVHLTFSTTVLDADTNAELKFDKSSLSLSAGQAGTLTASLGGTLPTPGIYDGYITIQGGSSRLNVPYLYLVGDGVPANIFTLLGDGDDGTVDQGIPDGGVVFQVTDQFGVPVAGIPVQFSVEQGGGSIQTPDSTTDQNGIAGAGAVYGKTPGPQVFSAQAGSLTVTFNDTARVLPVIKAAVNAASFQAGEGAAPGSYITLFGTGLSDDANTNTYATLPLSIDNASVSFDVPSANLSVPGRLYYVSPTQVNAFVPWELAGQSSAIIKINISETNGQTFTLPLVTYAPAFFEYTAGNQLWLAALDTGNKLITTTHPAVRGQIVELYANGLGPVTHQPATGDPAPSAPNLAETTTTPHVTIGGVDAPVQFSGLAPGFAGLYQLNVTVPASINPGTQQVIVEIGGVSSPAANLPVQ